MAMLPAVIISVWLSGLLAFGIIGGGVYLTYEWYRRAWAYNPQLDRYDFVPNLGLNLPTALLAAGLLLLIWALAGGAIMRLLAGRLSHSHAPGDAPQYTRAGVVHRLPRPDGSELQVECYGPDDGQPMILTHGWGANSTEWYYLKRQLTDRLTCPPW